MYEGYEEDRELLTDDFLEHFGVKGMKWGRRTGGADGGGSSSGLSNRELNKASRAKDADARRSEVEAARRRVYSGENKAAVKDAKAQYKLDKVELGSREAKKTLNQVKNKAYEDAVNSQEFLNGKEFAKTLALTAIPYVGGVVASVERQHSLKKKYGA